MFFVLIVMGYIVLAFIIPTLIFVLVPEGGVEWFFNQSWGIFASLAIGLTLAIAVGCLMRLITKKKGDPFVTFGLSDVVGLGIAGYLVSRKK